MFILVTIGFSYLIYLDAKTFRRRAPDLYDEHFVSRPTNWLFSSLFLLLFALPIYLLRRFRFEKEFFARQIATLYLDEARDEETTWQYTNDACGIVLIWSFFVLIFVVILQALSHFFNVLDLELNQSMILAVFSSLLMIGLIFNVTRKYPYDGFMTTVGLRRRHAPWITLLVVPFFIGVSLAALGANIMMTRPETPSTPMNRALEAVDSPLVLLVFMAIAILFAPLLEEIIFRGYFFSILKKLKGKKFAIVFITLIFGILHVDQYWGDWLAIFVVGLMGFSLTLLRSWIGSTIPSIVMHYTYNFFIVFIPIYTLIFSNLAFFEYQVLYPYLTTQKKEGLLLKSIKIQPDNMDAYNDLAWLYAEDGTNLNQALDWIDAALSMKPLDPGYLDTKAEVLYKMGRYDEAIGIEQDLVIKNPDSELFKTQLEKFLRAKEDGGL